MQPTMRLDVRRRGTSAAAAQISGPRDCKHGSRWPVITRWWIRLSFKTHRQSASGKHASQPTFLNSVAHPHASHTLCPWEPQGSADPSITMLLVLTPPLLTCVFRNICGIAMVRYYGFGQSIVQWRGHFSPPRQDEPLLWA